MQVGVVRPFREAGWSEVTIPLRGMHDAKVHETKCTMEVSESCIPRLGRSNTE
jgi:hypothetical protein